MIDLEGLAAHRGSLLGSEPGVVQPSQRKFESRIFDVMRQLDPSRGLLSRQKVTVSVSAMCQSNFGDQWAGLSQFK